MEIVITHTINETSVVLESTYTFEIGSRYDYAALMYVNNKKTTGDVPITTIPTTTDPRLNNVWTIDNIVDGYHKAELLMIPAFDTFAGISEEQDPQYIVQIGVIVYHEGLYYRAVKEIHDVWYAPTPDIDYNNWEVVDITCVEKVYNETFNATLPPHAQIFYQFDELVFYNALVYAFLDLSAQITKSCNICANPQIEVLRCLRDKYESVELAVAAGNYSGAQTIIESSQNLVNSCSC